MFWFDYPALRCLRRVLWRKLVHHGRVREDMGAGCPERIDLEFLRYVWRFNANSRPTLAAAFAEHGRHLHPVMFCRDPEVRRFPRRAALTRRLVRPKQIGS